MYKARPNTPLKTWQTWFNKAVSRIRSGVEARLCHHETCMYYGYRQVHYIGLARNRYHLNLMCAAPSPWPPDGRGAPKNRRYG